MKFYKQKNPINVEVVEGQTVETKRHGRLLPSSIRSIICGPSNCEKTNVLFSLLFSIRGLNFNNIYVFSKSLCQPKYKYLNTILSGIEGIGFFTFNNNSAVFPPEEARANSIMIFDDVAMEKQDNIRTYFAMGRHLSIDSFYLCQSYSAIPKQLIRDNANFIIIFKQDYANLLHIWKNHVNSDMSFKNFITLCHECWKKPYGFVVIDKDSEMNKGRYRKSFNDFAIL